MSKEEILKKIEKILNWYKEIYGPSYHTLFDTIYEDIENVL